MNTNNHKNRNKSFFFEEEIDQIKKDKNNLISEKIERKQSKNQSDFKDYKLKVEGEEIKLDTEKFDSIYPYIKEIFKKDSKSNKIVLPKWIEKSNLELYLNLVSTRKIPKLDLHITNSLIKISLYFKNYEIIKLLYHDSLIYNIDKHNCIQIIKEYIDKSEMTEIKEIQDEILVKCMEIASKNIFFILNNYQEELALLKRNTIENILEMYFESVSFTPNLDHSKLMRFLVNLRKVNDIYELLENERKKSLSSFENILKEGLVPINWKFKFCHSEEGFYRETEEFSQGNVHFAIVNHYDRLKDEFIIGIKITKVESFEDDSIIENENVIFSILSVCEIKELDYKSKIVFNCIFNNPKTKVMMTKINNFSKLLKNDDTIIHDLTLSIYFHLSYNFSAIVSHICKNFYEYHSLPSIAKLPRNILNVILKNKNLNVKNEDEILSALILYLNSKICSNLEAVDDIFQNLDWKKVSLDAILEFLINHSKVLVQSANLKEKIIKEFRRRFKEETLNSLAKSEEFVRSSSNLSKSKDKITNNNNTANTANFTSELVNKLIKMASKYDNPTRSTSSSSINATNNSNTGINVNSSHYFNKNKSPFNLSGNNTSRNDKSNVLNNSKSRFLMFQDINTSPVVSENFVRKNSIFEKLKRKKGDSSPSFPLKRTFIKEEIKSSYTKNEKNRNKSLTPSKLSSLVSIKDLSGSEIEKKEKRTLSINSNRQALAKENKSSTKAFFKTNNCDSKLAKNALNKEKVEKRGNCKISENRVNNHKQILTKNKSAGILKIK